MLHASRNTKQPLRGIYSAYRLTQNARDYDLGIIIPLEADAYGALLLRKRIDKCHTKHALRIIETHYA